MEEKEEEGQWDTRRKTMEETKREIETDDDCGDSEPGLVET